MADVSFSEVAKLPHRAPDQTIRYGSDSSQVADYWSTETVSPLLVFIHGGCWLNTYDRRHVQPPASAIADRGVAVLSIEYRRIGDAGGG